MDKFNALASFIEAVKLGSFSAAANRLGVSQPAVSQQVRALEDDIGTRLFNRTTRCLSLTDAGERYFAYACEILERMAEADRSVQSEEAQMSGRLTVSLSYAFAEPALARFLVEFKQTYPDILLDVRLSDAFVDLSKERIDVAIRIGTLDDDRLIARRLGEVPCCLVASPGYLDRTGRPEKPSDLEDKDFLVYPYHAVNGQLTLFKSGMVEESVAIKPTMIVNNSSALRHAAVAGLGVSTAVRWLADPYIRSGELEVVLADWSYDIRPIHAIYPSNRFIPMKVRRFVSDLETYAARQGAWRASVSDAAE